jgi:hypothetical protein
MSPTAGETHQGPEADHTPSHPGPRRCRRSITPHEVGRDLGAAWGRLPTVSRVIRLVPPHTGHSLVEAHGLGTGDGPEETIFHSNRRVWSKTWPAMVQGFSERTRNKSSDDGADLAAQVRTLTRQSGPPHYPLSAQVANRKPRPTQEPGTDACKTGTAAGTRECFFRGTVLGSEPGPRPQPPAECCVPPPPPETVSGAYHSRAKQSIPRSQAQPGSKAHQPGRLFISTSIALAGTAFDNPAV